MATTSENKALVERIFDGMARGDPSAFREAMADEMRWVFPGGWSWSGTWEPKAVVLGDLLRPLMAQFRSYRSELDLMVAEGDRVVAQVRSHATTTAGEAYEQTYCFIFRIASGRLVEVVEHCDTALVERVLQHPRPRLATG